MGISIGWDSYSLANIQMDQSGDGLKNYYTFAYHLKYCDSNIFNGYYYPNFDLTYFTDSQYGFVIILKLLSSYFPIISENPLLILNLLLRLSFLIGGLFLYKILKSKGINPYYAVIFAGFGIAMSPQFLRLPSHFALSHPIFLLSTWYFLEVLKSAENALTKIGCGIILFGIALFSAFIHPYQLIICTIFSMCFSLYWVTSSSFKGVLSSIPSLSSLLLFSSHLSIADKAEDRPQNPYGLDVYTTQWNDFLPGFVPFNNIFGNPSITEGLKEGYCYPSILVWLIALTCAIKLIPADKLFSNLKLATSNTYSLFFIGTLCLLFSMGLHLTLTGNHILEWVPPLRQFRSLGRFSWIFYYTFFAGGAIIFYQYFVRNAVGINKLFALAFIFFLLFVESYLYHKELYKIVEKYKVENLLRSQKSIQSILDTHKVSNAFEAIIPIPPLTEGGEKFGFKTDYFIKTRCLPYSFQTGTPLISGIMSRVPLNALCSSLAITNSQYGFKPKIEDKFNDEYPYLIVVNNAFKKEYSDFIERSVFIGQNDKISLFRIQKASLFFQEEIEVSEAFINISCDDSSEHIDEGFDHLNEEGIDNSKGLYLDERGKNVVLIKSLHVHKKQKHVLSFWQKLIPDNSTVPTFTISLKTKENIHIYDEFRDWDIKRTEVYKDWVRFEREYELAKGLYTLEFSANGEAIYLDNFLLKPDNLDTYYEFNNSEIFFNGYFGTQR